MNENTQLSYSSMYDHKYTILYGHAMRFKILDVTCTMMMTSLCVIRFGLGCR